MKPFRTPGLFLALLCMGTWVRGFASSPPGTLQILKNSSKGSSKAYQGRIVSFIKEDNQSHMADVRIFFQPPDKYRREFVTPEEKMKKIVVSDGVTEWIYFPNKKVAWKGDSSKTYEKLLTDDQEWDLITKNYDLIQKPDGKVAGRDAWVIRVEPKTKGKPKRTLWIDKAESVILQSKDYNPDGSLTVQSHFTDIAFASGFPPGTFDLALSTDTQTKDHGMDPDFLSIKDLQGANGKSVLYPRSLPDGFVFESADKFPVKGHDVTHLRFTDGLNVLSLFESRFPIGSSTQIFSRDKSEPSLDHVGFSRTGKVIYWKKGKDHFILVGDLATATLRKIKDSIK